MRVIPVIDLMGGVVVRAVAGRRHKYRPVVSSLVESADPLHVASRLLEASGATELYVADLDAITIGNPVTEQVRDFLEAWGVAVWFDGGFRSMGAAAEFVAPVRPVLASETIGQPVRGFPTSAYSIDLRHGVPMSDSPCTPFELATAAVAVGFETLIILDVARVGTETGPGTEALCAELRAEYPQVELIAGGGIRGRDDIRRLEAAGVDAVLVATALHDGRLP